MNLASLPFQHSFAEQFDREDNRFYSPVVPDGLQQPRMVSINWSLAETLAIDADELASDSGLRLMSGNWLPENTRPIAVVYSGHQFGVWAGQLGDGRAMTLGELPVDGERWDIQLKGAGPTPYSRFGDGRAVLRSSIREYLCSEAMFGLGIATTRALCVVDSETQVERERIERGATLCRVARSLIRFGSFEHFHYRKQPDAVAKLADYVIERHFPDWENNNDRYRLLLDYAIASTARLIAQWQSIGFNHGVMNTDNMSILGETLDYGPYGFLDAYNPDFICNHSDSQGRYAFRNQPMIGLWNLNALANAFLSLLPAEELRDALKAYEPEYQSQFYRLMGEKIDLPQPDEHEKTLIDQLLNMLAASNTDYTIFFRAMAHYRAGEENCELRDLIIDRTAFDNWSRDYSAALTNRNIDQQQRQQRLNRINPKYVLRNYMAQIAIEKAEQRDYSEVESLLRILQSPFDEHPGFEHYAGYPPDWAAKISVSCSS